MCQSSRGADDRPTNHTDRLLILDDGTVGSRGTVAVTAVRNACKNPATLLFVRSFVDEFSYGEAFADSGCSYLSYSNSRPSVGSN